MSVEFREKEIADAVTAIVGHVSEMDCDISIKIAALRGAADVLNNAIIVRSLAEMLARNHTK